MTAACGAATKRPNRSPGSASCATTLPATAALLRRYGATAPQTGRCAKKSLALGPRTGLEGGPSLPGRTVALRKPPASPVPAITLPAPPPLIRLPGWRPDSLDPPDLATPGGRFPGPGWRMPPDALVSERKRSRGQPVRKTELSCPPRDGAIPSGTVMSDRAPRPGRGLRHRRAPTPRVPVPAQRAASGSQRRWVGSAIPCPYHDDARGEARPRAARQRTRHRHRRPTGIVSEIPEHRRVDGTLNGVAGGWHNANEIPPASMRVIPPALSSARAAATSLIRKTRRARRGCGENGATHRRTRHTASRAATHAVDRPHDPPPSIVGWLGSLRRKKAFARLSRSGID